MKEQMEKVRDWVLAACSKGGFSDAHINHFEPTLRERSRWLTGAASVLREAEQARGEVRCDFGLAMVFTVKSDGQSEWLNFRTEEEFERQLDYSPPSIFIAEPGSEPWITSQSSEDVRTTVISEDTVRQVFPTMSACQGLQMEYRPKKEEEPSRTVWLISAPIL